MRRVAQVSIAVTTILTLSACTPAIVVGPEHELAVVPLEIGQELLVELPAEASSGRSWQVVETSDLLEQSGGSRFAPDSSAAGSPGLETLTFEATAAGQGRLRLEYRRDHESSSAAEDTYLVGLDVSE